CRSRRGRSARAGRRGETRRWLGGRGRGLRAWGGRRGRGRKARGGARGGARGLSAFFAGGGLLDFGRGHDDDGAGGFFHDGLGGAADEQVVEGGVAVGAEHDGIDALAGGVGEDGTGGAAVDDLGGDGDVVFGQRGFQVVELAAGVLFGGGEGLLEHLDADAVVGGDERGDETVEQDEFGTGIGEAEGGFDNDLGGRGEIYGDEDAFHKRWGLTGVWRGGGGVGIVGLRGAGGWVGGLVGVEVGADAPGVVADAVEPAHGVEARERGGGVEFAAGGAVEDVGAGLAAELGEAAGAVGDGGAPVVVGLVVQAGAAAGEDLAGQGDGVAVGGVGVPVREVGRGFERGLQAEEVVDGVELTEAGARHGFGGGHRGEAGDAGGELFEGGGDGGG